MAPAGYGPLPPNSGPATEIERIRSMVAQHFPVVDTRVTSQSIILAVHADATTLATRFDQLRQELWPKYYVPQIRPEGDHHVIEIVRRPRRTTWTNLTNAILLVLTVVTTIAAGAFLWLAYVGGSQLSASDFLWGGITFALPLMAILGLHELAHFVMARHHHVEASLPYFVPVPPPFLLFGTFGAFISLREPIPDKKALLDIGAAGPLAGFVVSIPVTLLGMFLSAHAPVLSVANCGPSVFGVSYGNLLFGTSLFWAGLGLFVPVTFANLHPVALAGWVGLLVTAINLLPAGQLDGGHVFRALLGERARFVSYAAVAVLFALGFLYPGWFIFALLIFVLGVRHPPPLNDITPLDAKRWAVGLLAVAILVTGFVIVPIASPSGAFSVNDRSTTSIAPSSGYAMADNLSMSIANGDVVSHGYLVSATIGSVYANVNGAPKPLEGANLTSFEANSTWRIVLPNGNVTSMNGSGVLTLPTEDYATLPAGGSAPVTITYMNTRSAVVDVTVTVEPLCNSGGPGAESFGFTLS
ncbi:MAG: site-2 protease family protein [Thermoplasmata archaeon]